jgi:hypothetical protein
MYNRWLLLRSMLSVGMILQAWIKFQGKGL